MLERWTRGVRRGWDRTGASMTRLEQSGLSTNAGQRGASAVEYVVLLTLITAAILVSVNLLGEKTRNAYEAVNPAFIGADEPTPPENKCGDKDSEDDEDCGKGND